MQICGILYISRQTDTHEPFSAADRRKSRAAGFLFRASRTIRFRIPVSYHKGDYTMADSKKEQEREELHRAIWAIADDLRGSVDGWDFKSYVLGTVIVRPVEK